MNSEMRKHYCYNISIDAIRYIKLKALVHIVVTSNGHSATVGNWLGMLTYIPSSH